MKPESALDRKYLDYQTVQSLARFSFVPRRFIDGRYTGRHASPQRGQSVEFRDFRQYTPGDDVGHVDWKVYARSDKLYVRLFEHETELCVNLIVDASQSMNYGAPEGGRKYDHACRLAAAIAFVILRSQDRVGFAMARQGLQDYQRPSDSLTQLLQMLDTMQDRWVADRAELGLALQQIAEPLRRGEIVIVFSDLWEDLDTLFQSVARINHQGGEVILFHVLHQDEINLPSWQGVTLVDSESHETLPVNLDEIRSDYSRRLDQYLAELRAGCQQFDVQYQFAPMSQPLQQTLERFLVRRCTR